MTTETGTDSADPDPAHTTPDIEVTVIVIPTEAILDHFINLHAIAPCITEVPACTATTVTCHTADPHHNNTSPERTVDPEHISPAGNIINQHIDHLPVCKQHLGNIRHKQVTIDDTPSEYYSSDEQDSDLEDDLN